MCDGEGGWRPVSAPVSVYVSMCLLLVFLVASIILHIGADQTPTMMTLSVLTKPLHDDPICTDQTSP